MEVKNSVLLDGCHIGRLSYIGDSIIGQNVQFGAGTQTQNVQPNHLPIQMEILGQKFTKHMSGLIMLAGCMVLMLVLQTIQYI